MKWSSNQLVQLLQDDDDEIISVEEIDEETAVKLFGKEEAARLFSGEELRHGQRCSSSS